MTPSVEWEGPVVAIASEDAAENMGYTRSLWPHAVYVEQNVMDGDVFMPCRILAHAPGRRALIRRMDGGSAIVPRSHTLRRPIGLPLLLIIAHDCDEVSQA